jgi:hypothetical protein
MPDGSEGQSGGQIREQLEASLARENATREALEQAHGVEPGSLKGVEPAKYAEKASELKAQREASDREAAARVLGIPVDQLDDYRKNLSTGGSQDEEQEVETPQSRTASLGSLGGRPASFDPDGDRARGLSEKDLITASLIAEAKQKR